jgi:CDP-glucose 4,6-dehydratase
MFGGIFKNKKILVTGHTGFKGAWLSLWLNRLGAEVHGFSVDIPTTPSLFEVADLSSILNDLRGDVADLACVLRVVHDTQPDFVFHLAAQPIVKTSYEHPSATFRTNVLGTVNILEAMASLSKPCIGIMITSDKCYENVEWEWGYRENDRLGGKDPYSASKAAAECAIGAMSHSYFEKDSSIRIAPVRAGNVIGGGDWAASRIVPDAARAWSKSEPVPIRSPHSTRPWQHVLEPLSGYLHLAQCLCQNRNLAGEAFNFGPSAEQNHTVFDLLCSLGHWWNFSDPESMIKIDEPPSFHEAGLLKLNCDKAFHKLNWRPTLAYSETVEYTAVWYREFYQNTQRNLLELTVSQIENYENLALRKSQEWTK